MCKVEVVKFTLAKNLVNTEKLQIEAEKTNHTLIRLPVSVNSGRTKRKQVGRMHILYWNVVKEDGMVKGKRERERVWEGAVYKSFICTLTAGQDLRLRTAHLLNYRHHLPHHHQCNRHLINPRTKGHGGINELHRPLLPLAVEDEEFTPTSSEPMSFCMTSESESSTCSDNNYCTFEGVGNLATCLAESHTHSSKEQPRIYAPCVLRRNESGSFIPKNETFVITLTHLCGGG